MGCRGCAIAVGPMLRHRTGTRLRRITETVGDSCERDAILGSSRACRAKFDFRQVDLDHVGKQRLGGGVVTPQTLRSGVRLDQLHMMKIPAGKREVAQRFDIDRKHRRGRAILWAHVRQRRPFRKREGGHSGAAKLHEGPDNPFYTQALRHGQNEIGGSDSRTQATHEAATDDLGDQDADGLAEHGGGGFDPADSPSEHAEAVDHRGVTVHADHRIGINERAILARTGPDNLGQAFQIDLMANTVSGRDDVKAVERFLSPSQESVALAVALEFELQIALRRARHAGDVDGHRMIHNQIERNHRVDVSRFATEFDDRIAHRRKICKQRDAR